MRKPFWIAIGVNALDILLDAALIFGIGPIPAMGIAGDAGAISISQWMDAPALRAPRPPPHRLHDQTASFGCKKAYARGRGP